jgi:SP family arabinose:H+ symporter-like MFS transporter
MPRVDTVNRRLKHTVLAAALAGTLLGFDTAVISGATHSLTLTFGFSPTQLGITVSAALWGTVVGAMAAGVMGRRLGARLSLLILGICYLLSALGCAFSHSWSALLLFRFIGGLGMGGSSVIAPVYIAEVAPASWRGRMVGTFQINIIMGILIAYLSNYLVGLAALGLAEWRWQLGVASVPAVVFLLMLVGTPPSPRWLILRGRLHEARAVLVELGVRRPDEELETIRRSIEQTGTSRERLFQWKYRRPILLAIALAMFNQLVGINAVLYYLNDIFAMAGFDRASQNLQAVAVGSANFVGTMIALSLIDHFGRRTLLLVGSVGLAVCLAAIGSILHSHSHLHWLLAFVVAYVGFFAFSQGAVIWVYLSEIFPSAVRAQGQSLGSATHWIMNALISGLFPILAARSQAAPFMLFFIMCVLQWFVVYLQFPETSGVTLEDMQRRLELQR